MAKINLTGFDVGGLLELREKVDAMLGEHQRTLQKQLDKLGLSKGRDGGNFVSNGRHAQRSKVARSPRSTEARKTPS